MTVTAPPYAQEMVLAPLPVSISPSRIGAFTDCPRLFQYQAVDRLPSPASKWTLKGTLVHSALEALFAVPAASRTLEVALAGLEGAAASEEGARGFLEIGLTTSADIEAYVADARVLVANYFALEDPTTIDAVGVELRLEADLSGDGDADAVHLRGILDRLDREPDGSLVVVDYKTGRAPAPGRERAKLAAVETYALLCERVLGERPVAVRLLHLREPVVIERAIGASEVSRQERRTVQVWGAIERAHAAGEFRPSPGPLCRYCSFSDRCEGGAAYLARPAP